MYAVVDDDTNSAFLDRCRAVNAPMLTSEWLIACLIHQTKVNENDSPRYRYMPGQTKITV